ncbi:hypothetical protein AB0D14_13765 [Streptomyces sp. NPDC048484]|uniref:hypothetical protein n=1 Tax=Streptomyces sp. NPDC048484 TaxID=3155146 RepID=UPI00343E71E9
MTCEAGEAGHIRPKLGTGVRNRTERDIREPDVEAGARPQATCEEARAAAPREGGGTAGKNPAAAVTSGAPVFVDPSGRRANRMRRVGWLVAAACVVSAATLGVVVTNGNSAAPWLHLPGTVGSERQNRSANEAGQQPERKEPGAPAADGPSSTAAGSPIRPRSETSTSAKALSVPRPDANGTTASPGGPPTAAPSSNGSATEPVPTDTGEAVTEQPSRTTSPETPQEPTTAPSTVDPPSPTASAEPSPTGTPATGLLDGLVTAASGLLGK